MANMIIPAGYWLKIKTWENDADHYKTQEFQGLPAEDVRFYLELARKFESASHNNGGLGNRNHPESVLLELVEKVLANHPNVSKEIREEFLGLDDEGQPDEDLVGDALHGLLGRPEEYWYDGGPFCRVFDSFELYEVKSPVTILDVKSQF